MSRLVFAFTVLASLVCFSPASGSIVVDQSQTNGANSGLSVVDPVFDISAQCFVSGLGVDNISGVRIALASGALSSITMEVYSAIAGGNPAVTGVTPQLIASQTLGTTFSGSQIIEVNFSTPAAILENTTYYLAFNGAAGDNGMFGGTTTSSYSGGFALTDPNRSGFTEFQNFDFYFETLTDTNFAVVPVG